MESSFLASVIENYQGVLSLYVVLGLVVTILIGKYLLLLVPQLKQASRINEQEAEKRMTRERYSAIQKRSSLWGGVASFTLFLVVFPFCLTDNHPRIVNVLLDSFVILMFYDFIYYLTHRFLFHDGPLGGPLRSIHSVHHQQKNPCFMDSNYLHPLETVIGLALYGASVLVIALLLGKFHPVTLVITSVIFLQVNQQNHRLMDLPYFPFRYLNKISAMHHVHHARFTAGNYATISLLYDWMFGTYDTGEGHSGRLFGKRSAK